MMKAKKLLEKHDYVVKVYGCEPEGFKCEALFPHPSILFPCSLRKHTLYEVNKDRTGILVTKSGESIESEPEVWGCPDHAIRLLIGCDIIKTARKLNISPALINYYKNNKKETQGGIADLIEEPKEESERNKEGFLNIFLQQSIKEGFRPEYEDVAETHGVSTSYRLLKSFF